MLLLRAKREDLLLRSLSLFLFLFFFLTFYFVLEYGQLTNNLGMVSGEQRSDSAIHTPKAPSERPLQVLNPSG